MSVATVNCKCPDRRPVDPDRPWASEYVCGHPSGALLEAPALGLVLLAEALEKTIDNDKDFSSSFEVFRKLARDDAYHDGVAQISSTERELWWAEFEEIEKLDRGTTRLPHRLVQRWRKCWPPSHDGPTPSLGQVLSSARSLCDASRNSGEPIEISAN